METTIYNDIYGFKLKLGRSKYRLFIDGYDTGMELHNDINTQCVKDLTNNNTGEHTVEEFIESYSEITCLLNNVQFFPSAQRFIQSYGECVGLHSAVYVEELREVHILSNSMCTLGDSDDEEFSKMYLYMQHVIYKNMCIRYNALMNNSSSTCGSLRKRFKGLLFMPSKVSSTCEVIESITLSYIEDNTKSNLGNLEILHRLSNGKHMSVDVKDSDRVSLVFHKNQLIQHFVNSDRDITKREFLKQTMLHIDLLHLLMFPDMQSVYGYLIPFGNTYEFIEDSSRDVSELIERVASGHTPTVVNYIDYIYYRNNINYMDLETFKQRVKEMF